MQPITPTGSTQHIPEFITNKPDPATGIPREDGDGDIHDNIYSSTTVSGHIGGAAHEGDMGRLSRLPGQ